MSKELPHFISMAYPINKVREGDVIEGLSPGRTFGVVTGQAFHRDDVVLILHTGECMVESKNKFVKLLGNVSLEAVKRFQE